MVLSLDIADMASEFLIFISFVEVPSLLLKVDPSYLKESTSSRFCQFIMVLMGMFWLALLTSTLLFSALAFSSSLIVRS